MNASSTAPWQPGAPIILRETWQGQVWTARPLTVVRDTPALLAFYMMPGTTYKHPRVLEDDRVPGPDARWPWRLIDVTWYGGGALYLSTPGAPYMVIGFRSGDNTRLAHWYVNLQDPLRRTPLGFDYLDQELDIIVSPDLGDYRWKDEEGFAELQRLGRIDPAKAARLRAVGERIIQERYAPDSFFRQGWEQWSPPPHWTVPTLPLKWHEL